MSILPKAGRNDLCPCGSGRKYKKCCLPAEEAETSPVASARTYSEKKQLIKCSDDFPVAACLINPDWKESGLARIAVARRQDDGCLLFGVYLVDILCLGLKSTFCNANFSPEVFESEILARGFMGQEPASIGIDYAKEIIFGAIDYAQKLGFAPDPDFGLSRHVLGSESLTQGRDIHFGGQEGKPIYVAGPNDDSPSVLRKLHERLGADGFEFVAPLDVSRHLQR